MISMRVVVLFNREDREHKNQKDRGRKRDCRSLTCTKYLPHCHLEECEVILMDTW
jgi:hypothetical protein